MVIAFSKQLCQITVDVLGLDFHIGLHGTLEFLRPLVCQGVDESGQECPSVLFNQSTELF